MEDRVNGDIVSSIETMLGLDDENKNNAIANISEVKTSDPEPFVENQNEIIKDIAKIEVKIEELKNSHVDEEDFYNHIDDYLTEDEAALEFEDKPSYMKIVAVKRKEYETKHSNADELKKLEDEKKELENVHSRSTAIIEVSHKYPDFNYEKIQNFFENKLSKEQQSKIYEQSKSYYDVYVHTYKMFIDVNPSQIKDEKVPNIPNLNNVRKQAIPNKAISDGLVSDDQKLRNALGI
jgi:hypothetical protein